MKKILLSAIVTLLYFSTTFAQNGTHLPMNTGTGSSTITNGGGCTSACLPVAPPTVINNYSSYYSNNNQPVPHILSVEEQVSKAKYPPLEFIAVIWGALKGIMPLLYDFVELLFFAWLIVVVFRNRKTLVALLK